MVVKPAIVRVQNCMGTSSAFQLSISSRERVNGLPRGFEQQVIGFVLMIPEQTPQLGRHRESDQEIPDWQQLSALPFQPRLALMLLTVGAAAMTTGMRQNNVLVAVLTFQEHHSTVLIAAPADGIEGVVMAW